MELIQTNSAESLAQLNTELKRLKSYFPYRICWGYVDIEKGAIAFASFDKQKMNKASRAGKIVYSL